MRKRNRKHLVRTACRIVRGLLAPDRPWAKDELERTTLAAGGVVLRYGIFWGPGTYGGEEVPVDVPHVHVETAAQRTVEALDAPSGIIEVVD